jgi:hypothetical protein
MSTSHDLRQTAKETIEGLSPQRLKVAAEFLQYLEQRASDEATAELLATPGLLSGLDRAEKDRKSGKGKNWRGIRKDV